MWKICQTKNKLESDFCSSFVTSVSANSERREHVGISTSFENASGNKDTLGVSNVNDETRHNIPDEVSELSVPETHFDKQPHTHHMVIGQTAQTNQFPEFLTGRILTPRNPPYKQTTSKRNHGIDLIIEYINFFLN